MLKYFLLSLLLSCHLGAKTIRLNKDNSVLLQGEIVPGTAYELMQKISALGDQKEIYLILYSPGGSMGEIDGFLKLVADRNLKIKTISVRAYSAAMYLAQELDRRYAVKNAVMMTHPAFFEKLQLTEEHLDLHIRVLPLAYRFYKASADRMGMTLQQFLDFAKKEVFLSAGQALKIGAIDEIIDVECSRELILDGGCPAELDQ